MAKNRSTINTRLNRQPSPYILFCKLIRPVIKSKYSIDIGFSKMGAILGILWAKNQQTSMKSSFSEFANIYKSSESFEDNLKIFLENHHNVINYFNQIMDMTQEQIDDMYNEYFVTKQKNMCELECTA
jgi:hypothetical protein